MLIDEDEFLRFRISERFNAIMKSLFDTHRKDDLPPVQSEIINDMKELVQIYISSSKTESENKAKAVVLCKELG